MIENVCVIPARGGSKRIPQKNIIDFCGKPMIVRSIEVAIESNLFCKVIVSTDDDEIASVSLDHGAEVPFMRPSSLSDDDTLLGPVMKHATEWIVEHDGAPNALCCLLATAPFVTAESLINSFAEFKSSGIAYCVPVTTFSYPIERAIRVKNNKTIEMIKPENYYVKSQSFEEAWHDAGQFYWGQTQAWLAQRPILSPESVAYPLPRHVVQDIDTPEDLQYAARMYMLSELVRS